MTLMTHDVLVPLRFLALMGHFFATLLALYAVRDNVIVSLPYHYDQAELIHRMWVARVAIYINFLCDATNAVSFFGGFSTFDTTLSLFHTTFHGISGILLAFTVINKGHYLF